MKISIDLCFFLVLIVLAITVTALAEQQADPAGDRQRQAQKDLAATRAPSTIGPPQKPITFNTVPSPTAIVWARPCKDGNNEYSFIVNDGDGKPIVSINECTGKVTVAHPERMNQQAVEFWRTVQRAWPAVCARPVK